MYIYIYAFFVLLLYFLFSWDMMAEASDNVALEMPAWFDEPLGNQYRIAPELIWSISMLF
jgi:hypothetical protein